MKIESHFDLAAVSVVGIVSLYYFADEDKELKLIKMFCEECKVRTDHENIWFNNHCFMKCIKCGNYEEL